MGKTIRRQPTKRKGQSGKRYLRENILNREAKKELKRY